MALRGQVSSPLNRGRIFPYGTDWSPRADNPPLMVHQVSANLELDFPVSPM